MGKFVQIYSTNDDRWLPDHAILWRYVPFKTLFLYLNGSIFLPSINKLRKLDPFEGQFFFETGIFNSAMQERFWAKEEEIDKWLYEQRCQDHERKQIDINMDYPNYGSLICEKRYFEFIRKTRYAWCWFWSPLESAAMWKNYGLQGCAISTTVGRVRKTLEQAGADFAFGRMRYVEVRGGTTTTLDWERSPDKLLLLEPHFLKRCEYESEQEVRFITTSHEYYREDGILLSGIKPAELFSEIKLWPRLSQSEEKTLKAAIRKVAPDILTTKSDLLDDPEDSDSAGTMLSQFDIEQWHTGGDKIPAILKDITVGFNQ